MNNLEDVANSIEAQLEEKYQVREIAIKSARVITRLSGSIVHAIHRGEDTSLMMHEAIDETHRLKSLLDAYPELWHSGLVEGALQELSEATILLALLNERDIPDPDQMGIPCDAYLLGLADTIGELRRFVLEKLREGDAEESAKYLDIMEEIFQILMRFDFPDALISIRRKQDIARSLLEKTRGDVAVALNSAMLQRKIDSLSRELNQK